MKKMVVRVSMFEEKDKKKAFKAVSGLSGVDYISVNMKDKLLTVIGDVDPVEVVGKLRKTWNAELVTVGPYKEPEKDKKKPLKAVSGSSGVDSISVKVTLEPDKKKKIPTKNDDKKKKKPTEKNDDKKKKKPTEKNDDKKKKKPTENDDKKKKKPEKKDNKKKKNTTAIMILAADTLHFISALI